MKTYSNSAPAPSTRQRRPAAELHLSRRPGRTPDAGDSRTAAQRQRIESAFGAPAQRATPDDEAQLKADPALAQRATPKDDDTLQGRFEAAQRVTPGEDDLATQRRADSGGTAAAPAAAPAAAAQPNRTGMPDGLKSGVESLSGMDLSDVRVHANSSQPAALDALAYAQGNDIHLAPGQEKQLPHEAWHVVQQRQGRVQPTMQLAGVAVNDDAALESEADAMGRQAVQSQDGRA